MNLRRRISNCLAVLLSAALLAPLVSGEDKTAATDDPPHDFILVVDVSYSMTGWYKDPANPKIIDPPTDEQAISWDGVQFTIDIARPKDRVALVVFRGEALVLSTLVDPSGFVEMTDKGRADLKKIVKEIQDTQVRAAQHNLAQIKNAPSAPKLDEGINLMEFVNQQRPKGPLLEKDLKDGTSIVLTLQTIQKELLTPKKDDDRQGIVLLFTDGFEQAPFGLGASAPYQYIQTLESIKHDRKALGDAVVPWVKPFQERQIPVFTFGIGKDCSEEFLEAISAGSTAPDSRFQATARYSAGNLTGNLAMFEQVKNLCWNLQQYWRPIGDSAPFQTPAIGPWDEMGVLLYTAKKSSSGMAEAPAPGSVKVEVIDGEKDQQANLSPRESRSHYYYSFPASERDKARLGGKAQLRFQIDPSDKDKAELDRHCYIVLRTKQLFQPVKPEVDKPRYTPKDRIPFEVAFNPDMASDAATRLRPEQFEVALKIAPIQERGKAERVLPKTLWNREDKDGKLLVLGGEHNVFRAKNAQAAGLLIDVDPASDGKGGLEGAYTIDTTIKYKEEYQLQLLRRVVRLKGYPDIALFPDNPQPPPVVLSNDSHATLRAELPVGLDMITDPEDLLTTATATIAERPKTGNGELDPTLFRWSHGKEVAAGNELPLYGRRGVFYLEVPAEQWANVPPGNHTGGTVTVKVPWSKASLPVSFAVRKTPYPVQVRCAPFSPTGSESHTHPVFASLKTDIKTKEPVYVTDDRSNYKDAKAGTFGFKAVVGDGEIKLDVDGLGKEFSAPGDDRVTPWGKAELRITAPKDKPLPGRYRHTFYVAGPAVVPQPFVVEVLVEQLGIVEVGPDGRLPGPDKIKAALTNELTLLGVAGTRVERKVAVYSLLENKELAAKAADGTLKLADERDRLQLLAQDIDRRVALSVPVPLQVEEGRYTTPIQFSVPGKAPAEPPQETGLAVNLQVVQHAVETDPRTPVLVVADCATATAKINVVTQSETAPVRWWVEQVKPEELQNDGKPGEPLPLVLEVRSATGENILGEGKAHGSLRRDRPFAATIEAACAKLAPGVYRARLRFKGWDEEHPPGAGDKSDPFLLDVTVLVAGRSMKLLPADNANCATGDKIKQQVEVTCFGKDCQPKAGSWQMLEERGPIQDLVKTTNDVQFPGQVQHYLFEFTLSPSRAGKNAFEVHWPQLCPGKPGGDPMVDPSGVLNARGRITVTPTVCGLNDEVTVEVLANPAALIGQPPVELLVVHEGETESAKTLVLEDKGGGRLVAKFRLERGGKYTLQPAGSANSLGLQPTVLFVEFDLQVPGDSPGKIEYGAGSLFSRGETVSYPGFIKLTNQNHAGAECTWRARLRYPIQVERGRDLSLLKRDPEGETAPKFDEDKYLVTRLLSDSAGDGDWPAGGKLGNGQTLDLGIESTLPEAAKSMIYEGLSDHPTLKGANGMVVEIEMTWQEGGRPVTRTVYVPFEVKTGRGWGLWALLVIMGLFGAVGAFFGWRWWQRRQRIRAAGLAPVGAANALTPEGEQAQGMPQRAGLFHWLFGERTAERQSPSAEQEGGSADGPPPPPDDDAGGDLLPDHLRDR